MDDPKRAVVDQFPERQPCSQWWSGPWLESLYSDQAARDDEALARLEMDLRQASGGTGLPK